MSSLEDKPEKTEEKTELLAEVPEKNEIDEKLKGMV